jgi:hypothetical protein
VDLYLGVVNAKSIEGGKDVLHRANAYAAGPEGGGVVGINHVGPNGLYGGLARKIGPYEPDACVGPCGQKPDDDVAPGVQSYAGEGYLFFKCALFHLIRITYKKHAKDKRSEKSTGYKEGWLALMCKKNNKAG